MRPVFGYNATGLQDITEVSATLYVDVNPGKPPAETVELQSAVYLRNQNRKPTALFSVEVVNNSIVLNASESTDPEEKALIYTWKIDNVGPADPPGDRNPADDAGDPRKLHRAARYLRRGALRRRDPHHLRARAGTGSELLMKRMRDERGRSS